MDEEDKKSASQDSQSESGSESEGSKSDDSQSNRSSQKSSKKSSVSGSGKKPAQKAEIDEEEEEEQKVGFENQDDQMMDSELHSPDKKQYQTVDDEEEDQMEQYAQIEAEILKYCEDNKCKWTDPKFPPDKSSLFKNPHKVPEFARDIKLIKWQRPNEINKDAKFMIEKEWEVKQGAFGDSWFTGALVIISSKEKNETEEGKEEKEQIDYIERLFIDTEHFDSHGFVAFQFFKNGSWKTVVVDTLLPYDSESRLICFGFCGNPQEFWVSLMEKAYAKLHGCYENITDIKMVDGLVDLTGGVVEKINLEEEDVQKKLDSATNSLWNQMLSYFQQKFFLGCIKIEQGKGTKNAEPGPHGILENHYYGIIDIRDFPKEQLKLIKIRNCWGPDGGWTGAFSDDDGQWDKHRNLREELRVAFKSKKSDGTWWMAFNDWHQNFNKFYICKVFPPNWSQFSIESRWFGKTSGGYCPPKIEFNQFEQFKDMKQPEYIQLDSDERWFNNPQFRLKVQKETKIYISLMQEDQKLSQTAYIKTNFMVIANSNRKNRIWERPPNKDIILDAISKKDADWVPQRELTQLVTLKKFEGKNYGYYIIVPNTQTENKKDEQRRFWLRLLASEPIDVVQMPETLEVSVDGNWNDDTAGGKRKDVQGKENPYWVKNPQYFLNLAEPTNLKIILKRGGQLKRNKHIKIGMNICRFDVSQIQYKIQQQAKNAKTNQLGKTGPKNQHNKMGLARLLAQTASHLEAPILENIERKLFIANGEKFKESLFYNDEVSALYFQLNPTDGPFIIIPSLDTKDKPSPYKMIIYSNNPVQLQQLNEKQNAVLIGRWVKEESAGGSHLNDEPHQKDAQKKTWNTNPRFLLQYADPSGTARIKVTLAIAEKNWKAKSSNTVGAMLGLYILEKKEQQKFSQEDIINFDQINFMPMNTISWESELKQINQLGYYIMPTTYEAGIEGIFILSVTSNQDFTLQSIK